MKDRKPRSGGDVGELGDISPELFREQLLRLAGWIADYRENIGERRISPNDEPGAIVARLDAAAPETAAPLDEIFADIKRIIVPGERSQALAARRRREGIPVPQSLVATLTQLGKVLGISWPAIEGVPAGASGQFW